MAFKKIWGSIGLKIFYYSNINIYNIKYFTLKTEKKKLVSSLQKCRWHERQRKMEIPD